MNVDDCAALASVAVTTTVAGRVLVVDLVTVAVATDVAVRV